MVLDKLVYLYFSFHLPFLGKGHENGAFLEMWWYIVVSEKYSVLIKSRKSGSPKAHGCFQKVFQQKQDGLTLIEFVSPCDYVSTRIRSSQSFHVSPNPCQLVSWFLFHIITERGPVTGDRATASALKDFIFLNHSLHSACNNLFVFCVFFFHRILTEL